MTERSSTYRRCPYCTYEYQPESGNYSDLVRDEICEKCGETFEAWDEVDVTFVTARKPKEKP